MHQTTAHVSIRLTRQHQYMMGQHKFSSMLSPCQETHFGAQALEQLWVLLRPLHRLAQTLLDGVQAPHVLPAHLGQLQRHLTHGAWAHPRLRNLEVLKLDLRVSIAWLIPGVCQSPAQALVSTSKHPTSSQRSHMHGAGAHPRLRYSEGFGRDLRFGTSQEVGKNV